MEEIAPAAFFSYSREDSDFALKLAGNLRTAGANVWLDQLDIVAGQRWDRSVEDALSKCPRLLVILSPASVNSTNVMDEVSFALEEKKTVIPVVYRDCTIPFRLRRLQYVDFRQDYTRGLEELLKTLAPEQRAEQGRLPISTGPKQTNGSAASQRERGADEERRTAAEEPRQTARQQVKPGLFSRVPAVTKVVAAVFAIFIIAFALYWALLPSSSNEQKGETQKQRTQTQSNNPAPTSPQQKGEAQEPERRVKASNPTPTPPQDRGQTQKREPKVEATNPAISEAEAPLRADDLLGDWQGSATLANRTPCSVRVQLANSALYFVAIFSGEGCVLNLDFFGGAWAFDPTSRTIQAEAMRMGQNKSSLKCRLTVENGGLGLQGTCQDLIFGSVSLRLTR